MPATHAMRATRCFRWATCAAILAAGCLAAGPALADPPWRQRGGPRHHPHWGPPPARYYPPPVYYHPPPPRYYAPPPVYYPPPPAYYPPPGFSFGFTVPLR